MTDGYKAEARTKSQYKLNWKSSTRSNDAVTHMCMYFFFLPHGLNLMLTRIRCRYSCLSLSRRSLKLGFRILINESFISYKSEGAESGRCLYLHWTEKNPNPHSRKIHPSLCEQKF